jgi:hypothetical protein
MAVVVEVAVTGPADEDAVDVGVVRSRPQRAAEILAADVWL